MVQLSQHNQSNPACFVCYPDRTDGEPAQQGLIQPAHIFPVNGLWNAHQRYKNDARCSFAPLLRKHPHYTNTQVRVRQEVVILARSATYLFYGLARK